jgi:hypothetical protein
LIHFLLLHHYNYDTTNQDYLMYHSYIIKTTSCFLPTMPPKTNSAKA